MQHAANSLKDKHFDILYTSPLGRTKRTAAIIAEAVNKQPVDLQDMIETDFGKWEGKESHRKFFFLR